MKSFIPLIAIAWLSVTQPGFAQNVLQIHTPSAQEETDHIWRTIIDIEFFEQHNYPVNLPRNGFIDSLKMRSKHKQLSDDDYEMLGKLMADHIYRPSDYEAGYRKIADQKELLQKMIRRLHQTDYDWPFKKFDRYRVNLTLYGSGGSYNPEDGSLIILTTPQGQFRQYDNPANTIIHEIVHIGIQESIIDRYQVPHTLKERIVDTFVLLNFREELPAYRLQEMGENRSDAYLKNKADLFNLEEAVQRMLKK